MKKITWEVEYCSLPLVTRHCKKCGKKVKFSCSKKFRVNAQGKTLDVWLIYNCLDCDTTWNAKLYTHISPQSFSSAQLSGFQENAPSLVEKYAMDHGFLYRSGVDEIEIPQYSIMGDTFSPKDDVELEIKSQYPFPLKVSSLVREKLHLSQHAYLHLVESGNIRSIPEQDLRRCKLKNSITLIFSQNNTASGDEA